MDFWVELRRRKVVRVAAAYMVVAWVIMQVVAVSMPALDLPTWFDGAVLLLLAIGFVVVVAMAWTFELSADGFKRTVAQPAGAAATPMSRVDIALVAGLVVLAALSLTQIVAPRPAASVASASAGPVSADGRPSIAVLPFVNMSSDPEQEYFSDGLSEELLNQLANLEGLRVIARTSSFAFKNQNADMRTIGEALGAGHLLEGSVRKSGDRLRITAQLIQVSDGSHLWSETYDRQLDDVFVVQDEISAAVAEQLQIALDVGGGPTAPRGGTDSVEAYDLYLRGRANARSGVFVEDGVEALEGAIALDPDFAEAWAELVTAYSYQVLGAATPEAARRAEASAESAALRAIEIAPDIWQSQAALANVRLIQRRWADADRAFDRARTLSEASGVDMGQPYWSYLMQIGRFEDALTALDRSVEADPLSRATANARLNLLYLLRRRNAPALEVVPPTMDIRVLDAVARRDGDEVRALLAEAGDSGLSGGAPAPNDPLLFAADNIDAQDAVLAAIGRATADPSSMSRLMLLRNANLAASFGDDDLALDLLRHAYVTSRGSSAQWFLWLPQLDDLRDRPEFKQLLRDIGLVDFWRETGKWGDFCRPVGDDDFECR